MQKRFWSKVRAKERVTTTHIKGLDGELRSGEEALSRWREHFDNLLNGNAGSGEEIRIEAREVQGEELGRDRCRRSEEGSEEDEKWESRWCMWYSGRDGEGWRVHNGAVVEGGFECGLEKWKDPSRVEGGYNHTYLQEGV